MPLVALVVLTACGGSGGNVLKAPTATSSTPAPSAQTAASPAPQGAGPAGAAPDNATGPLPQIKLTRVFPGQTFQQTTGMYAIPDRPGFFAVLEQKGRIITFNGADTNASRTITLDIRDRVDSDGSELGLLGLAFPPDFATSHVFYVNYTADKPLRTVIARYTWNADTMTANPTTEQKILEVGQPFTNHNGGQTTFGPDGFLWIAFGDGGSARDPMGNGQNRNVLLGKILRIDPRTPSSGRAYSVPPDNPFVGQPNTRDEVWAYGLRNPWRFSFDKATGELWAGDVGQNTREEVDIIRRGQNYGWNVMEGFGCMGGGDNCDKSGKVLPVIDYPTTGENCAITGGFVYRGDAIPALKGAYVYSDYCSGRIWALRYDGTKVTTQGQIGALNTQLSSFAEDPAGELYALAYGQNGGIYKLTP